MSEVNPYQPPEVPILPSDSKDYRVDDKFLWIRDGAVLPERCVYTNQTIEEDPNLKLIEKRLAWSSPWFGFLILLNILIYLIVALCVQKKGKVTFYANRQLLVRKRLKIGGLFIGLLTSIALFIYGAIQNSSNLESSMGVILTLVGFIGMVTIIIFMIRVGAAVRASKFQDGWFRLHGVGEPFLESLR